MTRLSKEGYDVLREREGLVLEAYLDTGGVLTIGLGHTSAAGPPVVREGMTITEAEAERIFRNDAERFRREVMHKLKYELAQHQFDACCSFLFNIGSANFLASTFLKRLNKGDAAGAAEAMLWWSKPPEIMSRRRAEHAQFTRGEYVARIL